MSIPKEENKAIQKVLSQLNPIEDIIGWITGLNSFDYTSDLLRKIHKFSNISEIKKSSRLISLYATNTIGLIEQAYSGPVEMSFLPLYYAIQNLSKIYVVCSGNWAELSRNRFHGASYNPINKISRDLMSEVITFKNKGILPLFYKTLTGETLSSHRKKIKLSDIYPFISGIGHEFCHVYDKPSSVHHIRLNVSGSTSSGFHLEALMILSPNSNPNAGDKRYLKLLKNVSADRQGNQIRYCSKSVFDSPREIAENILLQQVRRFLIIHPRMDNKKSSDLLE